MLDWELYFICFPTWKCARKYSRLHTAWWKVPPSNFFYGKAIHNIKLWLVSTVKPLNHKGFIEDWTKTSIIMIHSIELKTARNNRVFVSFPRTNLVLTRGGQVSWVRAPAKVDKQVLCGNAIANRPFFFSNPTFLFRTVDVGCTISSVDELGCIAV